MGPLEMLGEGGSIVSKALGLRRHRRHGYHALLGSHSRDHSCQYLMQAQVLEDEPGGTLLSLMPAQGLQQNKYKAAEAGKNIG